ncbi:MAG: S-layer homology domain-containing protein [Clostridia bacterium]|nr:S-layer homology domain-containing protein [Clostridia bacterium]
MKSGKFAAAILMIAAFSGISASAEIQKVEYSISDGIVTVTGNMNEGETAFLNVIKSGEGDFAEKLVYQTAKAYADGGSYSESFRIPEDYFNDADEERKITVKESINGTVSEYSFAMAEVSALEGLKTASDKVQYLKDNRYRIGLYLNGIDAAPDYSAIAAGMTASDYEQNPDGLCEELQRKMLYRYIQNGNVYNLFEFRELLEIDTFDSTGKVFTDDVFKEINQINATLRLKNKSFSTKQELEKALNEACVLAIVKNPDGYGNVKKAMEYFAADIGIDKNSGSQRIYTMLQNNDYSSYAELKAAFDKLVSNSKPGGSNGGGGGGSGSGSSNRITNVPYTIDGAHTAETVVDNAVKGFSDMAGYEWAAEAVENLKNKNIISGKEPGKFYPRDKITRSEFIKIAVIAFGIKDGSAELKFNDVDESRWDYPYINAAYSAGLIKGISDEYFGCTQPISRQDIAVIINRVKNIEGGELAERFADDRLIAEYAYDAVYDLRYKGIINGNESNMFNPVENATRAESAVIVYLAVR